MQGQVYRLTFEILKNKKDFSDDNYKSHRNYQKSKFRLIKIIKYELEISISQNSGQQL